MRQRRHRAVAEVKTGERRRQDQERLAFEKHTQPAGLVVLDAVFAHAARNPVIDRGARDQQHCRDRDRAEQRREPEDGGKAELPAEQTGEPGTGHVAGVVEGLVASVLPIEAGLIRDAESDADDRRTDRRAGDRGRDLRGGDEPEILRQQDQR
jgi:hypothetical protein